MKITTLMKLLTTRPGYQKALPSQSTEQQVASRRLALHSHSAKSPKDGDISRWLAPAKSLVMLFILPLMLSGCGDNSQPVAPAMAGKLCAAILNNGLSTLCMPSDEYQTIGIMLDSNDDELARKRCIDVAKKLEPMMADFSGQWRLEVFTPHRSDKPLNHCVLREPGKTG